jgi:purine-binding chemotaxis protein CheW
MNTREILRRRTQLLAERRSRAQESTGTPMLVFALGGERYGLPLRDIAEARLFDQCTPLPGAPHGISGVMNIRGDAYTVAELGVLLGLALAVERAPGFVLVLRAGPRIGLRVDSVLDVRPFAEEKLSPLPQAEASASYLKGSAPDQTMILDPDALLSHPALGGLATDARQGA